MAVMNKMRESMKTILIILVLAFVATIIFDWGMGGFQSGTPQGVIAEVNGDEITYEEFNNAYQQELRQQREQTGRDPEGYQLQQIENQVFERLVQQRLLRDVVQEMNLASSDEEIGEELWNNPPQLIRETPAFHDSLGQFDMSLYQSALQNPQLDEQWQSVIFYLRNTLPFQKLGNLINATTVVTDDDARIEFMKNNIKARAEYVFFDAANYAEQIQEPTDQEIQAYYNEHKEDFRQEETRVLDYVLIELKPSPSDSASVRNQAEELLTDAKEGRNFAELAEIYSQDPGSAENGGDLGYFTRTQMVKPFADAAFAANVGEIVGPVESQYGLHIIKIEDKRTENGEEQVKASHILLNFDPSNSTRDALRDEAEYVAEASKESSLRAIAEGENLNVQTTQPFTVEGFVPGIGMERRVNRWAFRAKEGDVSDVLLLDRGYLIAQLAEVNEEHIQPLEEVRSIIVSTLNSENRMKAAQAAAQEFYDKLSGNTPIDAVAAADSLELKQTDEFTASANIPGVGREPRFAGTAMSLEVGDISEPIEGTRGYYVLQVLDKTEFDEEAFAQQKESLKSQLAVRQRNQMFALWYTKLKDEANIKDYRNEYF